jgi:glyceraldehyde-3-phosphate dehydrogenase/erythrose-4-phosphate dehydrogenase
MASIAVNGLGRIGDPRASVVDAAMIRVVDGILVKVMSWYDNEGGAPAR